MKKVAIYARVSTKDQDISNQVDRLKKWAEWKGVEYDLFKDAGVSALAEYRPEFETMMNRVKEGHYDAIVFERLDRIARSMFHLVDISRELERNDTDMVVTEQSIDTSTAEGRLTFHVLGAISEFERELSRERAKKGFQKAMDAGTVGRPKKELPKERIIERYEAGATISGMCKDYDVSWKTLDSRLREWGMKE